MHASQSSLNWWHASVVAVVSEASVHLSYVPLAHIFERSVLLLCLSSGAAVGFYHGVQDGLLNDLRVLRPTVLCGLPNVHVVVGDAPPTIETRISAVLKYVKHSGYSLQLFETKMWTNCSSSPKNDELTNSFVTF